MGVDEGNLQVMENYGVAYLQLAIMVYILTSSNYYGVDVVRRKI